MMQNSKRILVIDDDVAILEVIKIILEEQKYSVTTVSESNSVLEMIDKMMPDLILLDIWMTGMDGQEITARLKSNPKTQDIPVILISANNEVEKIAVSAKADGFIAKPFDIDFLVETVKKYLR